MNDNIINQFAGNDGFGQANTAVMEDLVKALEAGAGTDSSNFTGGRALIPESLDKTLVNVLWNQEHAKLFKALKKQSVSSTVHEWNKRDGVGDADGAWVAEGGNSFEKNQDIARKTLQMKYLQTKRSATLQAVTANTLEGAEAIEVNAGTLWLIRQIEESMFNGNSAVIAEQPDGLDVLIPTENVIDLRGKKASDVEFEDAMTKGSRLIYDNYGMASELYASTITMQNVQERLRDRLRFQPGTDGVASQLFTKYPTNHGNLDLLSDVFIKAGSAPRPSTLSEKPDTPTATIAKANSSSLFGAGDAGAYFYKIVATSKYGDSIESSPLAVTVAENDIVTITITNVATLEASGATGIKVYRTPVGGTADQAVEIKGLLQAGVPATIDDENEELPGTSSCYLLNTSPSANVMEFAQFLPMMKFPLYPTNAAVYPFLMLLFGALALKKGEQTVRIKNIGEA